MYEIGDLRRIYGTYTVHQNIWTLHLVLCVSMAIVGRNKMQMRETHTQCVRVGRSASGNASIVQLNPSEEYTKLFSQEIHHTQVTQQAMLL